MLDEDLILNIVHDFESHENYKFSVVEFHKFQDREMETLWLELKIEQMKFTEGKNLQIIKSDIKKRMSNLLGLDRVILYFRIKDFY